MDLSQLGSLLREERERRGLSVEQVSDEIKITRTCITAIEEGKEESLPHPVYAKGFIKNYARLLGLDDAAFLENLSEIYRPEGTPERPVALDHGQAEGMSISADGEPEEGLRVLPILGVGLILLLLIGGGLWYFFKSSPHTPPTEQATTTEPTAPTPESAEPAPEDATATAMQEQPAAAPPAADSAQAPASAEPTPTPEAAATTPAPTPGQTPDTAAGPAPTPEDKATEAIAMSGSQAEAPAPVETPAPAAKGRQFTVGDRGTHRVVMTTTDRCWLQAGADGGTMHEVMLKPGDTFSGRFADYLLVRLGNAGAVQIQFDGKPYPLHSQGGAVKTLKFVSKNSEVLPGENGVAEEHPQDAKAPAGGAAKPAPTEGQAAKTATTAPAATADGNAAKSLEVTAQDSSWVILIPDGGAPKEVYVKKGQSVTVPFQNSIDVKLGNPSKVTFRYDGKETPVATKRGEYRTVHFPE